LTSPNIVCSPNQVLPKRHATTSMRCQMLLDKIIPTMVTLYILAIMGGSSRTSQKWSWSSALAIRTGKMHWITMNAHVRKQCNHEYYHKIMNWNKLFLQLIVLWKIVWMEVYARTMVQTTIVNARQAMKVQHVKPVRDNSHILLNITIA
jgi:hypothetical protein